MAKFERVFVGRTIWYWVKEEGLVYKCQYAAKGECSPAKGEVKNVIEHNGNHFVRSGKSWIRLALVDF